MRTYKPKARFIDGKWKIRFSHYEGYGDTPHEALEDMKKAMRVWQNWVANERREKHINEMIYGPPIMRA